MRALSIQTIGLPLLVAVSACAGDLEPITSPDSGVPPGGGEDVSHTDGADGSTTTRVNSSSETAWIYLDLESKAQVKPASPETSMDWDLAFQRFKVKINGGISGPGGMEAARIEGLAYDALTEAPSEGYVTDRADGDDDGDIPDFAITVGPSSETGPWAYNVDTHVLSGSGAVFAVRSVESNLYKIEFLEYYDENGNAGRVVMRWARLGAQLEPGVMLVPIPRGWNYLSIANGIVTIDDPATSTEWDLAVNGPAWQTNGGKDRAGVGGARLASAGVTFADLEKAPTTGFVTDSTIPYPGPPGSPNIVGNATLTDWFEYDATTHEAEPKDLVFIVRGATGNYGKLRIEAYDEPNRNYLLRLEPIEREVAVVSSSVDASARGEWSYFSFRMNGPVEVTDASTELGWDLGLSRTRLRTNSGTSGAGRGAAADPSVASLDAITAAPTSGFEEDSMLDDPERPGTQYSGNPSLAGWYELGTDTSTVPKDAAYVVRTADGGYVKVRVTGWNDGRYELDWAYAGAGQSSF